jgi:hypothetical protein
MQNKDQIVFKKVHDKHLQINYIKMLQPKISTVKFMQSHEDIIHLRPSKYRFMIGFTKLNSLKFSIISLYGRRIKS